MQMSCERVCVCVPVSLYVVVVWQCPMEEQFLYWMDFTLYKYIWNKNKILESRWLGSPEFECILLKFSCTKSEVLDFINNILISSNMAV